MTQVTLIAESIQPEMQACYDINKAENYRIN